MQTRRMALLLFVAALASLSVRAVHAQADDPAYASSVYLLRQAVVPQPDGRHNAALRGLRQLEDPGLRPLFNALVNSPNAPQRVHGYLGLAELNANRQLDIAALAEIDVTRELVEVLSAAMDDGLINQAGMATLLQWQGLDLPVRQAIAIRLMGHGTAVDVQPFRVSLDLELTDQVASARMMQYALAALILAEQGDPAGAAAFDALTAYESPIAELVIGQLLDAAMRYGLRSAGPLAVRVAGDNTRSSSMQMLALQSALRLEAPGAAAMWRTTFDQQTDFARRIRLAIIAMDASTHVDPALFDVLLADEGEIVRQIGAAGQAIAQRQPDLLPAFAPLIESQYPSAMQWLIVFCRRERPAQAPALLMAIVNSAMQEPPARSRNTTSPTQELASIAVQALCELHPEAAAELLAQAYNPLVAAGALGVAPRNRLIILLGMVRAHGVDLGPIVQALAVPQGAQLPQPMQLLLMARYDQPMSDAMWQGVAAVVQGAGGFDPGLQIQFAWCYLKHRGLSDQAVEQVLR